MPRSGPGAADRELIAQLAGRELTVSPAQLERWRSAGLLPRNTRHGRGRGRGSVSAPAHAAVEIAAALATHARQGRDLRLAVVDWFAAAGRVMPGDPPLPEPPYAAVRAALEWTTVTSPPYRLLRNARSASTDAEIDAFYAAAEKEISRTPIPPAFNPGAIREALLTGQDPPEATVQPQAIRSALVQVTAAMGLESGMVPADLLAEAVASSGLYPTVNADAVEQALARLSHLPPSVQPLADQFFLHYDPLAMVRLANAELLRRARHAADGLSGFGAMYLLYALLIPDTPGLAALRALIDELGLAQILMNISRAMNTTRGLADTLVICLHPMYQAIHNYLSSQIATGPPLFHGPDERHTAEKLMTDWIATIQGLTTAAANGAADGPHG